MKLIMAIFLTLAGLACHPKDSMPPSTRKDRLVSADEKEKTSAEELRTRYGQLAQYVKNGFTAYRITYKSTNRDGQEFLASGALFVPDTNMALPIFNYNHGTYFPSQEREAPSYLGKSYELVMGKLFAGAGYLVVMPDYPGYGESRDIEHPYGAYHEIAGSVIDMLFAVKEFCGKKNIHLSGKNFFCGWSEGAAVALATVKELEEGKISVFTPTTTVLNAGPYFSSGFVHHILDAERPLAHMNTYAWILQSYNKIYGINQPLSYYFREPAATALKKGPESGIPREPQKLFTQTFIDNYKSGRDSALQRALSENDLWNWRPGSAVVFCHGDKDDYVPLFNSEKAYEAMKEKGADVSLHVFKGDNHHSGILKFVRVAFNEFEKAR